MTERHDHHVTLRTASGGSLYGTKWREAANGRPEWQPYVRHPGDAQRDAEIAALVARAKAEAWRRVAADGISPAAVREQEPGHSHGCAGYTARGCRCDVCCRAISIRGALARAKANLTAGRPLTPLQAEALQLADGVSA